MSTTWTYLPVLNQCLNIIVTILVGVGFGRCRVFGDNAAATTVFVSLATRFVFYVALPCLVIRGLGMGVNFYNEQFLWNYIAAFLLLRVIALVIAIGWVALFQNKNSHYCRNNVDKGKKKKSTPPPPPSNDSGGGIGNLAVIWLSLTWISTVIMGVPIAEAVFGNATKGAFYGILAGISSFIFQLPLQLIMLECHALEQQQQQESLQTTIECKQQRQQPEDEGMQASSDVESCSTPNADTEDDLDEIQVDGEIDVSPTVPESPPTERDRGCRQHTYLQLIKRRDVWKRIGSRLLRNPVLWAIAIGFALSLSTIGPRYLNPTSGDNIAGLNWIWSTLLWIGNCVSPVSLFAMGVWMENQGRRLFRITLFEAFVFMVAKLILVPLITVGLVIAVNLNDEASRAAVLISTLPISLASFTLSNHYNIGEACLSANVALGTALMLPTVLLWSMALDAIGLFPIST